MQAFQNKQLTHYIYNKFNSNHPFNTIVPNSNKQENQEKRKLHKHEMQNIIFHNANLLVNELVPP